MILFYVLRFYDCSFSYAMILRVHHLFTMYVFYEMSFVENDETNKLLLQLCIFEICHFQYMNWGDTMIK